MSGRRNHLRFGLVSGWNASVRVTREVLVQEESGNELVVLSASPGVIDDELTLDMASGTRTVTVTVKVVGSRPVMVDGALRHELRLRQAERA